jgi:hypothetical protein
MVAVGAAVAAAVAAGLIVFFVTRSDGDSEQASAADTTTQPATTQPATTEAPPETETAPATTAAETAETGGATTEVTSETEISALMPNEVFKHCGIASTPRAGATETAVCVPLDAEESFPDQLEISTYPDGESVEAEFAKIQAEHDIQSDTGRCSGVQWGGEGTWNHGPDKPGGRRLCYFDGDDAVLVWTHEKLGQADHRDVLAIAREGGIDHARLFGWWRFWVHRIGKLGA